MVNTWSQRLYHTIGRCLTHLALIALILAGSNYSHAHQQSLDLDRIHVHGASNTDHVHHNTAPDDPVSQADIHCGAQILALCSEWLGFDVTRKSTVAAAKWLDVVSVEFGLEPPPPKTCF